jgi:hypothetical protein
MKTSFCANFTNVCTNSNKSNIMAWSPNRKSKSYNKAKCLDAIVVTLGLGSRPKQRLARVRTKKEPRESHLMHPGVYENVREWTFTFPNELPFWELDSRWTSESSKNDYKGQNPLYWSFPYIIGNLLECKCLKWARMTHLDTSNTSYGQKKGWESNWQFDSRPLKVENRPNFLTCKWRATYRLKALNKGYNFALNCTSIKGLQTSYGPPKSWESQLWKFRDSHLGVLGQNAIWVRVLWPNTEYTIMGKVVVSPKSRPWWVLWVWVCPWLVLTTKNVPAMH